MVALEPKLSRRLLQSRLSLTRDLKLPRIYARPGYYPTRYRLHYEPGTRVHRRARRADAATLKQFLAR